MNMLLIWNQSLVVTLFLCVANIIAQSNPTAVQKSFAGYCTDSFNQCQHVCIPILTKIGQFYCTCRSGYFIQNDGFSCNKTAPKDLEMIFEINPGEEKSEKLNNPFISVQVKKSTKKLITRQKRYTNSKSETVKPIKGLPKGKCKANSCKNGGVCQNMKGYTTNVHVISCLCRLGFEGLTCEKATSGVKFPKFLDGYLAFPEQILNDVDFRLSIYVKPANDSQADTIIAFKKSIKNNNFILGLENKQFIFRIETPELRKTISHPILVENSQNRWYKIEIERKDNDAKLSIDNVESTVSKQIYRDNEERYSVARIDNSSMSNHFICDYCLYLGGHPQLSQMVQKNQNLFVSIETSFIGCMRNFMIDEADIDMRRMPYYGRAVDGLGIDDCSIGLCDSPSSSIKCQNDGDCQVSKDFTPICNCRFGFTGPFCEQKLTIVLLSFNGNSFANYKGLKETSREQNDIFLKFKPISDTGLILYQGYSTDKRGDFLALYMINGYPWVSYDLGSGTVSLGSQRSLTLDEWHTIRFSRVGRRGTMIIDYEEPIFVFSPGSQLQLTIKQNLQLGGVDSVDNVSAFQSITQGFRGCIHTLVVDHVRIDLLGDLIKENSRNLLNCDSHPCGEPRKVCWEKAECIPIKERYICSCPLGYIEETCQTGIETSGISQPSFNGSSYLTFNDTALIKKLSSAKFDLTMVINLRTIQANRILMMLINKSGMKTDQYFSMVINSKNGIEINIKNSIDNIEENIIDNLPLMSDHRIQMIKNENTLKLQVNDSYSKTINLQYKALSDFGFSKLILGGPDLTTAIRLNLPLQSGMVGCIKKFQLDNEPMIKVSNALDGRSVGDCSSRYAPNSESLESRFYPN